LREVLAVGVDDVTVYRHFAKIGSEVICVKQAHLLGYQLTLGFRHAKLDLYRALATADYRRFLHGAVVLILHAATLLSPTVT
jgi:hypothetical protein